MSVSFSIIGTGKLGSVLCAALHNSHYEVVSVWNRNAERAQTLVNKLKLDSEWGQWPNKTDNLGDVIFVCVPDDQIVPVVQKLAGEFDLSGKYVVHTSGAHPGEILNPAKESGASVASFHPLQTFTGKSEAGVFQECWISIQGDEISVSTLESIGQKLGAQPKVVTADEKEELHVAAVFAGNYLVTLMEMAQQCVSNPELKSSIPSMFHALMAQVLDNIKEQGVERALTGPLSRGDDSTIVKHLDNLVEKPELLNMYKIFGRATMPIVKRNETLTSKKIEKLQLLLDE